MRTHFTLFILSGVRKLQQSYQLKATMSFIKFYTQCPVNLKGILNIENVCGLTYICGV